MSIKVFIPSTDHRADRLAYESKIVSPRTLLRAYRIAKETKSFYSLRIEIKGSSITRHEISDFCRGEYTVGNAEAFLKQLAA